MYKYRIRMSRLAWYVYTYDKDGNWISDEGPFADLPTAEAWSKSSGLYDWDKGEG